MTITLVNRQTLRRPDRRCIRRLVKLLLAETRPLNGGRIWRAVSVVLTDDAGIRTWNQLYLNRRRTTDVISFTCPPLPAPAAGWHGEIIVNLQRALAVGTRAGGASRELALYLAHGCDHLAGAEDRRHADYLRMRRRELRWLRRRAAARLRDRLLA